MTIRRFGFRSIITVMLSLSLSSLALGERLSVSNLGTDTVYFRSSAKLEFIEGVSTNLAGYVDLDPTVPGETAGRFQVDLTTLRTGIETRDEHMRDRHLETDKFPFAWFELTGLDRFRADAPEDEIQTTNASGYFYLHGVKRAIRPELEVVSLGQDAETDRYQVRAKFSIKLEDYKIDRPKLLFLKVAETIEVEILLKLKRGIEISPIELPQFESGN